MMTNILFLLLICGNVKYTVCSCDAWRDDGRCGGDFLAPNGEVAQCDPEGINPCCSPYNWCGHSEAHCDCDDCTDYREPGNLAWRDDYRCGGNFIAPNGEPAQCNPEGSNYCCSSHSWCGSTAKHCDCDGCIDYRITPCTTVATCNPRAVWNETACKCECENVERCNSRAVWNEDTCKCDCRPLQCLPGYKLNPTTCHCKCKKKTCPAGFVFDKSCCKCKCRRFSECGAGQYFSKETCQCETGFITVS
ncbi:Balbiani ring protein 3 [Holothuria leucospilota]|uniref:Balbiani ring protein 3 n=1 Tax=Holothuria leucospilota TaxID=206669 RepID=A0A9Q1C331_HOLLE|nr:Balbiani ring protein 3 [Holothuria leucospilota]